MKLSLVHIFSPFHGLIRISKVEPVLQAKKIPISLLILSGCITKNNICTHAAFTHVLSVSNPKYDDPLQDAT